MLAQSGQGVAEFNRKELAEKFQCAPSQINYVLETRFSLDHGFVVESRRGGGGYIRIIRVAPQNVQSIRDWLQAELADPISPRKAELILNRLIEEDVISKREAVLIMRVLQAETVEVGSSLADVFRAVILRSILYVILHSEREG